MSACRIPLGGGAFALVSPEDHAALSAYTWHLKRSRAGTLYAQRTVRLSPGRSGRKTAVLLHRQVLNAPVGASVDHVNGDGLDCRRSNLRLCSTRENSSNVRSSKSQKLGGFKGVFWNKRANKWEAAIGGGSVQSNGKRKRLYLGVFTEAADAARAYDAAALVAFGEFAALNFPAPAIAPETVANELDSQRVA